MPEGSFVGGPLDGMTYTLRGEGNVLAVDPDQSIAWLYVKLRTQTAGVPSYALDMTPGETDPVTGCRIYDEERSIAAVEAGCDVIVAPGEMPTQAEIDEEAVSTDDD